MNNLDVTYILSLVVSVVTIIGTIYAFLRNFKTDINSHIDRLKNRMDKVEKEWREESRKMDQRVKEANKRMDGVYHILLKKLEPKTDS